MGEERRGDERKAKEMEETVVCNTQLAEVGDLGCGAGTKSGERHGQKGVIAETAAEDRRSSSVQSGWHVAFVLCCDCQAHSYMWMPVC